MFLFCLNFILFPFHSLSLPQFNSFSFYFLILFIIVVYYKYFYLDSEEQKRMFEMNNGLLCVVLVVVVCVLSANSTMKIKCHFLETNSIISLAAHRLCTFDAEHFIFLTLLFRGLWNGNQFEWLWYVCVCVCMNLILILFYFCGVKNFTISPSVIHLYTTNLFLCHYLIFNSYGTQRLWRLFLWTAILLLISTQICQWLMNFIEINFYPSQ